MRDDSLLRQAMNSSRLQLETGATWSFMNARAGTDPKIERH